MSKIAIRVALAALVVILIPPFLAGAEESAEAKPTFTPPCRGDVWWADTKATFGDFDFWVGEWLVFDRASGVLMGFDTIEKAFEGCALSQTWRQMNDRFSTPGAPWRLEGGSYTALGADGRWHQTWLDNGGSFMPLAGGLDGDGVMVLESDWLEFKDRQGRPSKLKYRLHWAPQEDGTIHNWGFIQNGMAEAPEWVKYFDIVYRKNSAGGPALRMVEGAG